MTKLKNRLWLIKLDIIYEPEKWAARLMFALGPFIMFIPVEIMNGNNPFTSVELWRVLWNFGWYIAIFALFWLICGRRKRAGAISASVFLFFAGLVNCYVLRFRGTMFFPIDILSWRTAANVSGGYDFTPDGSMLLAAAITLAYILVWALALPTPKGAKRAGRLFTGITAGALAVFLFVFFCTGFLPSINLYAEQWVTQRNGFIFNFMLSLRYSFASEPEGYSIELVEDIQEEVRLENPESENGESAVIPENVIIIMNESLADLSVFENFDSTRDPLEFIHSLRENTVSGWFYSPVFGGGTANVEYEVLTCNPTHFLPDGTVAYQFYVDCETPSLASLLGEMGYTSYAFHPYLSSGWNRIQAYNYLGFDSQFYDEDVEEPLIVREYISDESDYELIRGITEEDEGRTFVFNVTMQNHSGYGKAWTNLPRSISASGVIDDADSTVDQYLSLVDLSDKAFEELIEYYSQSDETTLIAMFGDHQPPLSTEFYNLLMGGTAAELSSEEMLEKYKTPFLIWANYDIPESRDLELSGNFFGLLVSDLAGVARSDYMELVADVMEEIPVIHDLGYVTADGKFVEDFDDLDKEQQELIREYELVAYHMLFDRREGDEFYSLP